MMPGHYKTVFSINYPGATDSLEGHDLLRDVDNFIIERLSADQGQPSLEREHDGDDDMAYSVIRTERPVSADGSIVARLEIRLWANDYDIQLAIQSQVIAPDAEGDQSYRYSAPRMVSALTKRYLCLDNEAQVSTSRAMSLPVSDLAHLLYKSHRQLPVLLISPTNAGHFPIDLKRIKEYLLGLAHVAIVDPASHATLGPSVRCYNGASRLLWPSPSLNYSGPKPKSQYYSPQQSASKDFPTQLRHDLLTEPPHFSPFEETFLQIRSDCILRRNLKLEKVIRETAPAATPIPASTRANLRTLRRELRKTQRQHKSLQSHNSQLQDEINRMQTEITNLNCRLLGSPTANDLLESSEITRSLQADLATERFQSTEKDAEIKRLLEKIDAQNSTINNLRLRSEALRHQMQKQNFIENISPTFKRLTSLNHALNIVRDPIRKYIVQNLRQTYDGNVFQRFQRSIDMEFISPEQARAHPESVIDFGHFPDLVKHNSEAFDDADYLWGVLEKIRRDRNKVVHPDVDAANITSQLARELLNNIVRAKGIIGSRRNMEAA